MYGGGKCIGFSEMKKSKAWISCIGADGYGIYFRSALGLSTESF
jgi:hypothetical protein